MVRVLKPIDLCVILALHVDKRAVVTLNLWPAAQEPSTNFNRSEVAGTFFKQEISVKNPKATGCPGLEISWA